VVSSGWSLLDDELPGRGWPCQSITEVLTPQPSVVEWRLLSPALRQVSAAGSQVVIVAPPRLPYLPGLLHEGLDDRQCVWIRAEAPAERLWVTEQLVASNACGAIVAWLPQARSEQIRRLQVAALGARGPVFLCRPDAARHESSAAPLRVQATFGLNWEVVVQVLKRRGPLSDQPLHLPSVPGGLASVLTPRLRQPSRLFAREVPADAVGRTAVSARPRRQAAAH
jgi:protein ImuA